MIEFVTGDFFDYAADIRINTVNCVGVMGAGVALEFKTRYPDMFKAYVDVCKKKKIAPGQPFLWEEYDLFNKCMIVNLPTKIHWRDPSEYEYIEKDLVWLRDYLEKQEDGIVVTLPALGCGHGGLNWDIVKNKICHYLGDIKAKILVFEPASSNKNLAGMHYGANLLGKDVKTIYPNEGEYPRKFQACLGKEIYCKGNEEILHYKRVNLIVGNNVTDKEKKAILRIIQEISKDKTTLVLGLNNKKHCELAVDLLEQGYNLLLVIPYGILRYKNEIDLNRFHRNVIILSTVMPNQDFKRYEYINSLKFRLSIADVSLYCSENLEDIKRDIKYLKNSNPLFYINYWTNIVQEFIYVNAKRIGVNAETKKPNVQMIQQYLAEIEV